MEIESTVLNVSCMMVALLIAMGSAILTYVKTIFYYDYAQSTWGRVLRTVFWLLLGGFGSIIEGICFERMGYSEKNFLINAFWIVLFVGCCFWLFEVLTSHDKEPGKVAVIIGRVLLILVLYRSMLYALTTMLQKKIVLSENWMWQLTEILLYYFITVKIAISIENKIQEVKRGEVLRIITNIENLHEK